MKIHYHLYNSVSFVPIINHIKSFEVLPAYFVKTHFNIILLCVPRFQNVLPISGLPVKALYAFLFFRHACHITNQFHPRFYYHIIIW